MARRRKSEEIEGIASALMSRYVTSVRVYRSQRGHPVMALTFPDGHRMTITENEQLDRLLAHKMPHQKYSVRILDPNGKEITNKKYLTAKMVKLAILKTRKLEVLKGVKTWA